MKVLFLDIDGVCNSLEYAQRNNMNLWHATDPELVKLVRRIIDETKCDVVLSSTWRLYPEAREVVKRDVCHFIDCTVDYQAGAKRGIVERGLEVQAWLDKHPEVTRYAILDDDSDFLPDQALFKTTFEKGLTPEIAQQVIHHLNANDNIALANSR